MAETVGGLENPEIRRHRVETVAYTLFAVLALGAVFYLCYFRPVIYARMVNEDLWGEYGTAVGDGMAGMLFLFLAARPGPWLRRCLWALTGLAAAFLAGEELSWGQRIFHYSVPGMFYRLNTQDEVNLHNLAALDDVNREGLLRQAAAWLVLGWSALSLLIALLSPRLHERLEKSGPSLIPVRLLPLFLTVPYLFMARPLPRADEIGELFFAAALLAWGVDLYLRHAPPVAPRNGRAVLIMLGVFLTGALLSAAAARKFPGSMKGALDSMVSRYTGEGMYAQAEQIYQYIYAHPRLLKPETRIDHARMLLALGRKEAARRDLRQALQELEKDHRSADKRGEYLRCRGVALALLGESAQAKAEFAAAIAFDRRQAQQAPDADEKAESLWSVAQTLQARGDHAGALIISRQAVGIAVSGKLKRKVKEWIEFQQDPAAAEARLKL